MLWRMAAAESDPLVEDEDHDNVVEACVLLPVRENVYWEAVVTCSRCTSCDRILGSLCILAVTLASALLLSAVLVPAVAVDQLAPKLASGNKFEEWRDGDYDGQEISEGKPWVYWVCHGEDWSFQEKSIEDYKEYTDESLPLFHMSNGRVFGLVAITLWLAVMILDFRRLCNYALLLWLPRGAVGECYLRGPGGARLVAVPTCAKVVIVVTVFLRFNILCSLLYHGSAFLAYSESLKDFILNSVALGFILDIDELVYFAFISGSKQRCLVALGTVKVATNKFVANVHDRYVEIINVVILCICVALAYVALVDTFASNIQLQVYCVVCKDYNFPQCRS